MSTQKEHDEKYPEHVKQSKVIERSAAILKFLDWAQEEKFIEFAVQDQKTDWLSPSFTPNRNLVAEFYGLDENKLEAERRAMIEDLLQG